MVQTVQMVQMLPSTPTDSPGLVAALLHLKPRRRGLVVLETVSTGRGRLTLEHAAGSLPFTFLLNLLQK